MGISYTIYSPRYVNYHGGVRALHVLKDELNKRGYQASMHYDYHIEGSFVIYPEIEPGNPLNAKHYCHWLLNTRDLPGLTFGWAKDMGSENLLTVNIIEENIFYPRFNERKGVAYWTGKGDSSGFVIPDNAIRITTANPPLRTQLADLLASVEYFLTFDDYTALTLEATILGTPTLVQTRNIEASKQRLIKSEFPMYGVIYDLNDLNKAKAEVYKQHEAYSKFTKQFDERIDNFIKTTKAIIA